MEGNVLPGKCRETIPLLLLLPKGDLDIIPAGVGWGEGRSPTSRLSQLCRAAHQGFGGSGGCWRSVLGRGPVQLLAFLVSLLLESCSCFLPVGGKRGLAEKEK